MKTLADLLNASQARHSHLCPRQVLGVRIALARLSLLDFDMESPSIRRKGLLVIAETFVNTKTGQAVRVHPAADVCQIAQEYFPEEKCAYFAQLKGYQVIPDSELLKIQGVRLNQDIPKVLGSPKQRSRCIQCEEEIINGQEILVGELTWCAACAGEAYYHSYDNTIKVESKKLFESVSLR